MEKSLINNISYYTSYDFYDIFNEYHNGNYSFLASIIKDGFESNSLPDEKLEDIILNYHCSCAICLVSEDGKNSTSQIEGGVPLVASILNMLKIYPDNENYENEKAKIIRNIIVSIRLLDKNQAPKFQANLLFNKFMI